MTTYNASIQYNAPVLYNDVGLPTASQSSPGKPKKSRRVFLEKDGQVLVFDSAAEAALYVTAEKEAEQPSTKKQVLRIKQRKVPEPEVINYEALKAFYAAIQQQEEVARIEAAIRQRDYETLLGIQIALNVYLAEEDDIETLLLLI